MDVHSSSYTLCCVQPTFDRNDHVFACMTIPPTVEDVKKYLRKLEERHAALNRQTRFICGYEAGCMGYSLYHDLSRAGIECVILAPSTMPQYPKNIIKTDRRDAERIAQSLAYNTYKPVYVPSAEDEEVKNYLRLRDDHKLAQKKIKQQILAFCLRHGIQYAPERSKWTQAHLAWLHGLELTALNRETLDEYLLTYEISVSRMAAFDQRIEELASREAYREPVRQLSCFTGIKTYTSLSILVETGDFNRFSHAEQYAKYLGLTPGEHSSGDHIQRTGITKGGNSHVRRLLIEAAQCYCRGRIGAKSRALKLRQEGNHPKVILYADRASERLRRKYYRMLKKNKKRNVVVTAVARELACFVWGMMTQHFETRKIG